MTVAALSETAEIGGPSQRSKRSIKVLIWDLDHTLWDGILSEGDEVRLRPGVIETIHTLDRRGILQSIASKNNHDVAMAKLAELGLADYFLYPQISWGAKSQGVAQIAKSINVGLDSLAFIDDQPFERDEVTHALPAVLTLDRDELGDLGGRPEFMPRFVTEESSQRRAMYQADISRNRAEETFAGAQEDFLAALGLEFTLGAAREEDLQRAEELTQRTHQLNTTGYTYCYEELDAFRTSPDHLLLVAGLTDRYGAYGKIGLGLVEKSPTLWTVKLLLMSCRVMSRGVGTIMINYILNQARAEGVALQAEFKATDHNRMMMVTYKFAGFREAGRRDDGVTLFAHDLQRVQPYPPYVRLSIVA